MDTRTLFTETRYVWESIAGAWELYGIVLLALMGWLAKRDSPLGRPHKAILAVAVVVLCINQLVRINQLGAAHRAFLGEVRNRVETAYTITHASSSDSGRSDKERIETKELRDFYTSHRGGVRFPEQLAGLVFAGLALLMIRYG